MLQITTGKLPNYLITRAFGMLYSVIMVINWYTKYWYTKLPNDTNNQWYIYIYNFFGTLRVISGNILYATGITQLPAHYRISVQIGNDKVWYDIFGIKFHPQII